MPLHIRRCLTDSILLTAILYIQTNMSCRRRIHYSLLWLTPQTAATHVECHEPGHHIGRAEKSIVVGYDCVLVLCCQFSITVLRVTPVQPEQHWTLTPNKNYRLSSINILQIFTHTSRVFYFFHHALFYLYMVHSKFTTLLLIFCLEIIDNGVCFVKCMYIYVSVPLCNLPLLMLRENFYMTIFC